MDNFSKLRPPDAIRIKVRVITAYSPKSLNDGVTTSTCRNEASESSSPSFQRPRSMQISSTDLNAQLNTAHLLTVANNTYQIVDAKKLFVDPQMTSYEMLSGLIVQAFDIKQ